ncbi:helix-turn-helix domain-containing protein [Patescibacteria group bacterium]|nr:helix-turn-helix domain-containing protein [Patescibacteria group bacterium]MBU4452939.1 helix-turn-helix domain-containing protein [Patescibacteria group bacterium]MCG2687924.1 helix-turn-helix domain-containing protein [Candidatus Parcubacteria bacterium]
MNNYASVKSRLLKDKQVNKAYDQLEPEFAVIEKLIEKRIKSGLSQAQLAEKIGTKQSAISRFESGTYNPSMSFLYKVAEGIDAKITIKVS